MSIDMKSIDVLSWVQSKAFPFPIQGATLFEWYNHPENIAEDYDLPLQKVKTFPQ